MHPRSLLPAAALTLALAACLETSPPAATSPATPAPPPPASTSPAPTATPEPPPPASTAPAPTARSAPVGVSKNAQGEPELKIDPADQVCRSDDDCVVRLTQCECDCGSPVNRPNAEKYDEALHRACEGYKGRMCKMAPCTDFATCDGGVCRIKTK